jgi:predicted nucleic acid-binding protein
VIVVDASAIVDLLVRRDETGDWLADRIGAEAALEAPAVFELEVLQAFRGLEAAGALDQATLAEALDDFVDLRVIAHDHRFLRGRVWALRHNLTAYDAAYVALAELLDAPLITTDARLARAVGDIAIVEAPPV